jgi:hypothetical protein
MNVAASSSAVPPISPMRTIPERHRLVFNTEKNARWDRAVLTEKSIWM